MSHFQDGIKPGIRVITPEGEGTFIRWDESAKVVVRVGSFYRLFEYYELQEPPPPPPRWQRFKAFLSYLNRGGKNPGVTGFLCIIISIMWWVSIANGYWIEMAITTAVIGAVYVYGSWRNYNGKQA